MQGYPLSPLILTLALDPLADNMLMGFQDGSHENKLALCAAILG